MNGFSSRQYFRFSFHFKKRGDGGEALIVTKRTPNTHIIGSERLKKLLATVCFFPRNPGNSSNKILLHGASFHVSAVLGRRARDWAQSVHNHLTTSSLHLRNHESIEHCFLTYTHTTCLEERHPEKHA